MPFEITPTEIPDVVVVEPREFPDERGSFAELFKHSDFKEAGISETFTQFNISRSTKGVLRGLHYQLDPHSQGKLVMVLAGEVYDVAVDLRASSPTFKKWVGFTLTASPLKAMYIPPGFAHGFYVTSETADIIYFCTDEYDPTSERGIIWNDSDLGIDWPSSSPELSDKDKDYPAFVAAEYNFT